MRELIKGKTRDTEQMESIICRDGNCLAEASVLMRDYYDNTYYHFYGNNQLAHIDNLPAFIRSQAYILSNSESKRIQELIAG